MKTPTSARSGSHARSWLNYENINNVRNYDIDNSDSDSEANFEDSDSFLQNQTSKFIYLPVKFKTLQVAALIDSGSSIDIMSDRLYNSLPQSCKLRSLDTSTRDTVKLANSQSVDIVGTSIVKMYTQGERHELFVYILKFTAHPLILGTTYLT